MVNASPTPPVRIQITERDLAEHPALRLPIKGKVAVIPDTPGDCHPPEIVEQEEKENRKVSKKRRKRDRKAAWNDMESFSSVDARPENTLEERIVNKVVARLGSTKNQKKGEGSPSLPSTSGGTPDTKMQRKEPVPPGNNRGQTPSEKEGDLRCAKK